MEGTQKSYTITTDDDCAIKRAVLADGMAMALWDFSQILRGLEKYSDSDVSVEVYESLRDEFTMTLDHHGICLDDLHE